MDSYKRFTDEEYKNWLKTAESLYILRSKISGLVENETESYHRTLREKLEGRTCESGKKCSLNKKSPKEIHICATCKKWKDVIYENHLHPREIHWENCQPFLWPEHKWEVAKAYMIRGVKTRKSFENFDISSILNFMKNCKHFAAFQKGTCLNKVLNVRNTLMHSPDFKLTGNQMKEGIKTILELAKILENNAPGLKSISQDIEKFSKVLEKYTGKDLQSEEKSKKEDIELLEREQYAMKEKIQFLAQRFEDDKTAELNEDVKSMKNFFDQNKDLLENLGPQIEQLNDIQEQLNRHEEKINTLTTTVDQLVKDKHDPMFSSDPLKFKNHVFEEAKRRNMPEPVFTEKTEASGYRGQVDFNGVFFEGLQICNSKKGAHQEVAKIVLDYLASLPDRTEESSTSVQSATSSKIFYASVTVLLENQEFSSDDCSSKVEATESAYRKLAHQFGLNAPDDGTNVKSFVLDYFNKCGFPTPSEELVQQDKFCCKLQLSGSFIFQSRCGSAKKKEAEQQAAKVALNHLSGLLNCGSVDDLDENYKGCLKEYLEALGLKSPVYNFKSKRSPEEPEDSFMSEDRTQTSTSQVTVNNSALQRKDSVPVTRLQPEVSCVSADKVQVTESQKFSSTEPQEKSSRSITGDIFYSSVTVVLEKQEVQSDGFAQEEEATESAYRKLAVDLSLTFLDKGTNVKTEILKYFGKCNFPAPAEFIVTVEEKKICKLHLSGIFKFYDQVGSKRKKQAEQQAAQVALKHLSGLLNCDFKDVEGTNYKGLLKECLEGRALKGPEYNYESNEEITGKSEDPHTYVLSTQGSNMNSTIQPEADVPMVIDQPTDHPIHVEELQAKRNNTCSPDIPHKVSRMHDTEIYRLLELYNLKAPYAEITVSSEENCSCKVHINLENFTFINNKTYNSKKDAIRKTYFILGTALGILPPTTDETKATMLVKQHFTQKSLTHPKEDFKDNKCSFTDVTYNLVYEGQGSAEEEAKQDALQNAKKALCLLGGFEALPDCSLSKDTEAQINNLLNRLSQKGVAFSPIITLHKSSVQLAFKRYIMESISQGSKKANRNNLSQRILGLFGENPDPNSPSFKYCLDEWFKRNNQESPVFEDTNAPCGAKVTFSAQTSCSHSDWEHSMDAANQKLIQELATRLQYLTDSKER